MNIDWDGKGLPPVGIVCLISDDEGHDSYYAHHAGREATILLHDVNSSGDPCAVYWVLDDLGFKEYHALTGDCGNFKPIRSAEQIAKDKRKADIEQMYNIFYNLPGRAAEGGIAALYDAGYRKFEIVGDDV